MTAAAKVNPVSKNWFRLLILVTVFVLPVVIAAGLRLTDWRPARTMNHGQLVQPPRPIDDVSLRTISGENLRFRELRGKWLMVTFGSGDCRRVCEKTLYKMRQSHIAQGKNQKRVRRLFVLTPGAGTERLRSALSDYPAMKVVIGPPGDVRQLGAQFITPSGTALDGGNRIYLVDPLGNFLMSYPANADPAGIRRDLDRLLRVSRIG